MQDGTPWLGNNVRDHPGMIQDGTPWLGNNVRDHPGMIQRTWERVMLASSLDHVVVATDDERIAQCCRGFGADVIMTSVSCQNGSERCCEALQKLEKHYDIVVNIQGDEPLIEPDIIDGVVMALQLAPDAVFSTAVTALKPEDAFDTNRVKCVVDNQGYAIYFSRGLFPFNKSGKVNPQFPYLLHLGIAGFDSKFLRIYPQLPPTLLQLEEDLEQLKVLENGYRMKMSKLIFIGASVYAEGARDMARAPKFVPYAGHCVVAWSRHECDSLPDVFSKKGLLATIEHDLIHSFI